MIGAHGQELSQGWAQVPLRDVLLPTTTINPTTGKEGTFLYIDIEAVDNQRQRVSAPRRIENALAPSRARNALRAGDVIFSLVRPYLKNIAIIPTELDSAVASTAFFVCRPGQDIDSRFLLNFLRREVFIASITTYGSSPPAARDEEFERLPVLVPPSAEQSRIADVLDELFSDLDAGVAALERVREKLKLYRASVLKAAVEGALTADWRVQHPHTEPATELLNCILVERRRHWEEDQLARFKAKGQEPPNNWKAKYKEPVALDITNLPELPRGWCWATIDQVGEVRLGRQRAPQHHHGNHMRPYLRVANVYEDSLDLTDVKEMNFTPEEFATYALRFGDILLNEGQSLELVGRPAMYRDEISECCFQNTLVRFRASLAVTAQYALIVFRGYLHSGRFRKIANITTSIAHLGAERLIGIEFPLPPVAEQEDIVEAAEDQLSVIDHLESDIDAKLQSAQALRQSILRHAFTGQLVPQDPNDEPSSELLQRIASQREARARETAAAKQAKKKPVQPGKSRHGRSEKKKAKDD